MKQLLRATLIKLYKYRYLQLKSKEKISIIYEAGKDKKYYYSFKIIH
jgi:hypothetical protein